MSRMYVYSLVHETNNYVEQITVVSYYIQILQQATNQYALQQQIQ